MLENTGILVCSSSMCVYFDDMIEDHDDSVVLELRRNKQARKDKKFGLNF